MWFRQRLVASTDAPPCQIHKTSKSSLERSTSKGKRRDGEGQEPRRVCYVRSMENRTYRDVGGTPGGFGHFVIGCVMTCLGGYFLANQVSVVGSYWSFYGANTFGLTLAPMLIGIGILFWNGKSILGWLLTVAGALFIFAGVIANMHIYFRPTSLFNTLVMLVLFVGGLGLVARSLVPSQK